MIDKQLGKLARRLNQLFETVHPADRGPYSNEEAARAIRAQGGDISKQYVAYLRKGERDNPRLHHLEALANFFGVRAAYFFEEDPTYDAVPPELVRDAGHLANPEVRQLVRQAVDLSPRTLHFAALMLQELRRLEGLPTQRTESNL